MISDIKIYSTNDFPAYLPKLNQLYDDLFEGGKGFRAQLVAQISEYVDLSENTIQLLAQTVEFIHNSSLLHDDLIDRSPLRRGKTAAWVEYGPEYTVLAGDYLLARVIVNLSSHGHIGLVGITGQAISDLLEGEWLQDSIRHNPEVTWDEMVKVHKLKTASLFSWCLKAPFVFKNYDPKVISLLSEMGEDMGALLQRSDDLLDFDIRNSEGKTTFTDLKAGYLNLFAIALFNTTELRKEAFNMSSLQEVYSLVGEQHFQKTLQTFDDENKKIITRTIENAKKLQSDCNLSPEFVEFIKVIAPKLYWRE